MCRCLQRVGGAGPPKFLRLEPPLSRTPLLVLLSLPPSSPMLLHSSVPCTGSRYANVSSTKSSPSLSKPCSHLSLHTSEVSSPSNPLVPLALPPVSLFSGHHALRRSKSPTALFALLLLSSGINSLLIFDPSHQLHQAQTLRLLHLLSHLPHPSSTPSSKLTSFTGHFHPSQPRSRTVSTASTRNFH